MFKIVAFAALLLGAANAQISKVTTTTACTAQQVDIPTNIGLNLNTSQPVWVPTGGLRLIQPLFSCAAPPTTSGVTRKLQAAGVLGWLVLICNRSPFSALTSGSTPPSLCAGSIISNANKAGFHKALTTVEFLITLTPTLSSVRSGATVNPNVFVPTAVTASNPVIVSGTYKWANARKIISTIGLTFTPNGAVATPPTTTRWSITVTVTYVKAYYPFPAL